MFKRFHGHDQDKDDTKTTICLNMMDKSTEFFFFNGGHISNIVHKTVFIRFPWLLPHCVSILRLYPCNGHGNCCMCSVTVFLCCSCDILLFILV